MSDEEKTEFAETPIDALIEKWFDAVVDRTWIFRDEHGFKNPKKTTKKIIKKIKKRCQAENPQKKCQNDRFSAYYMCNKKILKTGEKNMSVYFNKKR